MAEMMPKIGIAYQAQPIDLVAVYGRDNPKILEIGTGMGETTAQIADANRDSDYLGVEVHVPGVGAFRDAIIEWPTLLFIYFVSYQTVDCFLFCQSFTNENFVYLPKIRI